MLAIHKPFSQIGSVFQLRIMYIRGKAFSKSLSDKQDRRNNGQRVTMDWQVYVGKQSITIFFKMIVDNPIYGLSRELRLGSIISLKLLYFFQAHSWISEDNSNHYKYMQWKLITTLRFFVNLGRFTVNMACLTMLMLVYAWVYVYFVKCCKVLGNIR